VSHSKNGVWFWTAGIMTVGGEGEGNRSSFRKQLGQWDLGILVLTITLLSIFVNKDNSKIVLQCIPG